MTELTREERALAERWEPAMILAHRDGMEGLSAAEDAYFRVTIRPDPVEVEQTLLRALPAPVQVKQLTLL